MRCVGLVTLLLLTTLSAPAPQVRAANELPEGPHFKTNVWEMTIHAAIVGAQFGEPLDWGPNEDGRQFVLVTLRVKNLSSTNQVIKSSQFSMIDGEDFVIADDDLSKRPDPLEIRAMGERKGTELQPAESEDFILGWRVSPDLNTFVLNFDTSINDQVNELNLAPWLALDIDPDGLIPTADSGGSLSGLLDGLVIIFFGACVVLIIWGLVDWRNKRKEVVAKAERERVRHAQRVAEEAERERVRRLDKAADIEREQIRYMKNIAEIEREEVRQAEKAAEAERERVRRAEAERERVRRAEAERERVRRAEAERERVRAQKAAEAERERVRHAEDLGRLLVGSGADFEQSVGSVLASQGYSLDRTGGAGDRGVDLRGTAPDGSLVIVQCKRYGPDNKVASRSVQSFIGAIVIEGAAAGIFVTTSAFTGEALLLAKQSRVPVCLIDGPTFTAMARSAAEVTTVQR